MTIQFRSTRTDGSRGPWHDILTPDGYGRSWVAPDQGRIAIEFREKPGDGCTCIGCTADVRQLDSARAITDAIVANDYAAFEASLSKPDPNPACTCDGADFHASDCPT